MRLVLTSADPEYVCMVVDSYYKSRAHLLNMVSPSTWLASSRFHRSFILPADPDSNRPKQLRVTYSDIGYGFNDTAVPTHDSQPTPKAVVIFIGGLMGGRYTLLRQHDFCLQNGIRILTIDRPGFGGSDPVSISQRISTWLATFPALLAHLKVHHVAIASHSGGAIYAMNTILHHRRLLHPTRPRVTFLAPWVYPDDSGSMNVLTWLPRSGPANFDKWVRLLHNYVAPMIGFSSAASGFLVSDAMENRERDLSASEISGDGGSHDKAHEDAKWIKEASTLIMKYIVSEDISGSSDEATLLLRKSKPILRWGGDSWVDYGQATKLIAAEYSDVRELDVSVFHAATDILNGPGGAVYFDRCWEDLSKMPGNVKVKYSSKQCQGTNHDSIVDPLKGPLRTWLLDLITKE